MILSFIELNTSAILFCLMQDSIPSTFEAGKLLAGYTASDALKLVEQARNYRGSAFLTDAAASVGIPLQTLCRWMDNLDELNRIAQSEQQEFRKTHVPDSDKFRSQFVPLSRGIASVQSDEAFRYRDILSLSLGLNPQAEALGKDAIAAQLGVHPTTIFNRMLYAQLELLEGLGLLPEDDPVNVFHKTRNSTYRRGPHERTPDRQISEQDQKVIQGLAQNLRRRQELHNELATIDRRWLTTDVQCSTLAEIAAERRVQENTVHRWELNGTHALHQYSVLKNEEIHKARRMWAGCVYYLFTLRPGPAKRLLSRVLDSPEVWKVPNILQSMDPRSVNVIEHSIGLVDGIVPEATELAPRLEISRQALGQQCAVIFRSVADELSMQTHTIDWLNTIERNVLSKHSLSASELLTLKELQKFTDALQSLEQQGYEKQVIALRCRLGMNGDGVVYQAGAAAKKAGLSDKTIQKSVRSILQKVEVYLCKTPTLQS